MATALGHRPGAVAPPGSSSSAAVARQTRAPDGAPEGPDPQSVWADALLAAQLLAIDPHGLGGVHVRAQAGPVRQCWLDRLAASLSAAESAPDPATGGASRPGATTRPSVDAAPRPTAAPRKLPLSIGDDRLIGGLDLAATLACGRPVVQRGLLAESDGRVIVVPMAERLALSVAAQLAIALDRGEVQVAREGVSAIEPARFGVVALDEAGADDEPFAAALAERLGFTIDLRAVGVRDVDAADASLPELARPGHGPDLAAARARLASVEVPEPVVQALCAAALVLGVASLRASWFALQAARASAAWHGRAVIEEDDAALAVRLVLAGRATRLPTAEPPPEPPQEPAEPPPPERADADTPPDEPPPDPPPVPEEPLDDRVLEAALAAIPAGLLAQLALGDRSRQRARSRGKAGQARLGGRRGAPAGVRRERPGGAARLSLIDTLRAAAPWQPLRRAQAGLSGSPGRDAGASTGPAAPRARPVGHGAVDGPRVHVRPEDFHVRRHQQRSATTTVFAVDASGSQALHRLAEAKGAVELLLADCYVRRDSVALVSFRGAGAEVLLPPTRSLVRAKRGLAGLPGGGGTPLASGLDAAFGVADAVRRRGDTPMLVLLTDGRANIARDGSPGRPQAEADARLAARQWRAAGLRSLLIDTSPTSGPLARQLALEMGATYLALPHADARAVSGAVAAAQRSVGGLPASTTANAPGLRGATVSRASGIADPGR
ncbi:MAG: magnesium chelatase subunit D [Ideonella sp.]|nr:magnesium chelatase subunit D [Ideonella sp.]